MYAFKAYIQVVCVCRNMGHWRLTFQFAFADMLGYKYVWQVDDDTEFKARETLNVTDYMQGKLVAGENQPTTAG